MWEAALLVLSGKHVSNNAHFKGGRCEAAVFFLNPFGAVQSGFTARRSKLWSMLNTFMIGTYTSTEFWVHGMKRSSNSP